MLEFLKYLLTRGNLIDIAWFFVGIWTLGLFLFILLHQIFRRVGRRKPKANFS